MANNSILVTGFDPFGEHTVNASALVAQALHGSEVSGFRIEGAVLPVVFGEAAERLKEKIAEVAPAAVICLGIAGGRTDISIERVAINLDDADIPDNAGNHPVDQAILEEAPPAYWSSLPVKPLLAALQENSIPASLSMSAGNYVCNHVFFHLLHHLQEQPETRGGFIHLPTPDAFAENEKDYLFTMLESTKIVIHSLAQEGEW